MGPSQTIAQFIAYTGVVPSRIVHEAKRSLINLLGVALAAAHDQPAEILVRLAEGEGCTPQATVIGQTLRTSLCNATLLNGYLAHLHDYDDTHFPTVLHPSAPVWPAVLASAEAFHLSGKATLIAFVLGTEVACRLALSVHPWHYNQGWHITGTAGVFGAAAGAGRALGLSAEQLAVALGIAGTQASGVREVFGTDVKALHPAKAASNGLQSALLARAGFSGPDDIIGGRRGFWAVLSPDGHSETALLDGLGERWELDNNGLKPYANGVVAHPLQDAIISLRNTHRLNPEQVTSITARVHPLVLELTNRPQPRRGLEGKFSFQHCAAVALVDGEGHNAQFTDARVADPTIVNLRSRVSATVDPSLGEDEAHVTIVLNDGRTLLQHVAHATGSPANRMSDTQLEAKYRTLASDVLPSGQAEQLLKAVWHMDEADDVTELTALMAP